MSYATKLPIVVVALSLWACSDNGNNGVGPIPPEAPGPDATTDGPAQEPGAAGSDGAVTDAGLFKIDRSNLADASLDHPLDYGDPNLWVCKPGIDPNPCYGDKGELDSTEILPDGTTAVVKHVRAQDPKFDCFYVYPTVYLTGNGGNQTDLSNVDNVLDALMAQGARMSRICEVYAPLYRQVNIAPNMVIPPDAGPAPGAGSTDAGPTDAGPTDASNAAPASDASSLANGPPATPGFMNAAADVNNAFKYYLDHYNHGRKFVLMGHSQGSGMLISVMQTQLETNDTVRAQLISALIIGGGVTVNSGQTTGGTFQKIPTCTRPDETGCVVAYSSFDTNGPDPTSIFGFSQGGQDVACTNPGPLAGNLGPYKGSYFPLHINNPLFRSQAPPPTVGADAGTAYLLYRDAFMGNCVAKHNAHYLEIQKLIDAGDPRGMPSYASLPGFGLHVYDWHFPMDDLIDVVSQQAAAAGL
jgi:hypothetical protein